MTAREDLDMLKALSIARGYRFEIDPDGTERMYRPDGTLAVTARQREKPNGNAIVPSRGDTPSR